MYVERHKVYIMYCEGEGTRTCVFSPNGNLWTKLLQVQGFTVPNGGGDD